MTYRITVFFSFILIYPTSYIQESLERLELDGANGAKRTNGLQVYVDEQVNVIK
jgi:hypothetical protein